MLEVKFVLVFDIWNLEFVLEFGFWNLELNSIIFEPMLSFPNAKINLGLHITRKRNDGFHDIETVFYPVKLCDALEIIPSGKKDSSLTLHGTALPPAGENLCMKALHLLQKDFEIPAVEMHLLKHIPAGAGLGGGSSDAAYTLRMLNDMFLLKISHEELENYAAQLGSDCPFFIRNKPVFAIGRGELFSPVLVDLSNYHITIINPGIHIPTPEAYSMIRPIAGRPSPREITQLPIQEWKGMLINDFEKPIFEKYPEIESLRDNFYEKGAVYAAMSGSGSSVFGIIDQSLTLDP